ncbi:nucleoside permease [Mucilaginibacter phyllosphaerae]|uniref:MFS transporter n=1 Tax=Mucilaginibacter phyllosphaerae TaxID=1812349 RepID=A0A4Y8A7A2_9SPHI|nr:nucleoside permease [Mucilaginibacter phyllosphaerae]MBB3970801.1 NHS family xanthosine MFS transporter [Mucilaginibacter phyllosphaerae]TEW64259.1 MFS transporter [Mucilaginibacter phyllosphaerae]GGH04694.1 xanthosine permease [Mucilaginibacter phyllosphaerae]
MNIKFRLILMNFMQFFIWGAWLLTIGAYWFQNKQWSATNFAAIFSTMGIASIFTPAISGIISDRFINAEKLYGIMHILGAVTLFCLPLVENPVTFFWVLLLNMMFYMPTLSLSITVAYSALKNSNIDIVKEYPPIRIWGTIGFIVALWTVSLTHNETSSNQFYIASAVSLCLGVYAFTLPKCRPFAVRTGNKSFTNLLGLNAFALFKTPRFAIFFAFSLLLGAALQLTNAYGDTYIHDFAKVAAYKNLVPVRYPAIIMSISQISETLFILAIPFFLRRFGIKYVMLFSMLAWVLRFGLFAFGDPANGLWMIVLSCIVYGMAFDFFNISGSLFVETQTTPEIRGSAQGLFMMMVNGFGALFGSFASGYIIDKYFTLADHSKNWHGIWLTFAGYALAIAIVFPFIFKYKHNAALKQAIENA